jgi:hypothetical protein
MAAPRGQAPAARSTTGAAMSVFGKLLKTAFDVATLPVDAVKDFATLGGAVNDKGGGTYTGDKLRRLGQDSEEIRDELDAL